MGVLYCCMYDMCIGYPYIHILTTSTQGPRIHQTPLPNQIALWCDLFCCACWWAPGIRHFLSCRHLPYANHTIPYHTIPYHTIPYHTIPYHTVPYHTIPYDTIPYHIISYHTVPYHTVPYPTTPYHTIPYHTIPYRTTPYHTIPHHMRPVLCSTCLSLPFSPGNSDTHEAQESPFVGQHDDCNGVSTSTRVYDYMYTMVHTIAPATTGDSTRVFSASVSLAPAPALYASAELPRWRFPAVFWFEGITFSPTPSVLAHTPPLSWRDGGALRRCWLGRIT